MYISLEQEDEARTELYKLRKDDDVVNSEIKEMFEEKQVEISGNVKTSQERNWVFAINSYFLIPISLQPDVVDFGNFKLQVLLSQLVYV